MPTAAEPTPGEPSTEPDPAQVATWLELLAGQLARPRLVRNRARCRGCEQEIESTSRHDFVTCRCGRTSVDGGLDYAKRGWDGAGPGFEELAEYESVDDIRGRLRRHTTPPPH